MRVAVTEGRVRTVRVQLVARAPQGPVLAATADSATTEAAGTAVMVVIAAMRATTGVSVAAETAGRTAIGRTAMAVLAVVRHAVVAMARTVVLATALTVAAVTMRALMQVARMLGAPTPGAPMPGAVTLSP